MFPRIILAPSFDLAKIFEADVTIEAEYGNDVILGAKFTAAHHQKEGCFSKKESPSPCNNPEIPVMSSDDIVLVSHFDLDTLGGCLRTVEEATDLFEDSNASFWHLAEFVDLNGPHKLGTRMASTRDVGRLYAFWAWARCVPRFPRDKITDISEWIAAGGTALRMIFSGDEKMLADGIEMQLQKQALNLRTFSRKAPCGVIVRKSEGEFCNHLYVPPGGEPHRAVVCHDTKTGAITMSLADPTPGVSCRAIVQELWGPDAGGHDGIAGSPRGKVMTADDLQRAVGLLADYLGPVL